MSSPSFFLITHRSSMKPLNGANPVPRPTMITEHVERYGNLSVDFLTYIGTTGASSPVCYIVCILHERVE